MAIREDDEPVHRCSRQGAHEQLASHPIGAPNQHYLRVESREMGLQVPVPVKVTLGPTSMAGITTSMISCENGVGNSLGGGAGS